MVTHGRYSAPTVALLGPEFGALMASAFGPRCRSAWVLLVVGVVQQPIVIRNPNSVLRTSPSAFGRRFCRSAVGLRRSVFGHAVRCRVRGYADTRINPSPVARARDFARPSRAVAPCPRARRCGAIPCALRRTGRAPVARSPGRRVTRAPYAPIRPAVVIPSVVLPPRPSPPVSRLPSLPLDVVSNLPSLSISPHTVHSIIERGGSTSRGWGRRREGRTEGVEVVVAS